MLKTILALSKTSRLRNINPVEKLLFSILPIVLIGFSNNPMPIVINIIVFILAHIICKNNRKIVLKFTIEISVFVAISSVALVFDYGLRYCFILVLKSLNAGLCLSFFSLTTSIDDLLNVCSKIDWLRDMCDIAKVMERFIILIGDEFEILHMSMKSRGGFMGYKLSIINYGKLGGLLFLNTMKRWKYIKEGLDSRCYRGVISYLNKEFKTSILRESLIVVYLTFLYFIIYKNI